MSELSVFVYPWDLRADGVEQVVGTLAASGATRLVVAGAYHSAELLSPRRTAQVFTRAEANTVHLPLPEATFSQLAATPSTIATDDPGLFPTLAESTRAAGLELDGWVVALHNSRLAVDHPEAAIVSCFGDRFTHGLCPAHPATRRYAVELFAGLAGTGLFDRLFAESVSYLLHGHGHPHELWGARLDVTTRYLLSLCFCPSCLAGAARQDVDAEALRARVAAELTRTWNAPSPAGRTPDDGLELASLLVNWPELAAYTRFRLETVTSLVTEIAAGCRARGTALDVSAAVWGRPSPLNWLEGVDISATLRIADGFVLESYYPEAADVVREIDHTQALASALDAPAAELGVALTLWPEHHAHRDGFVAKVAAVRAAGVTRLGLYNYATATADTLGWVREAAAAFTAA